MRTLIFAFAAGLTCAAFASGPLPALQDIMSPSKIEMRAIDNVPPQVDVPEKIQVVGSVTPGSVGLESEHWGEKKSLYYGALEWQEGKGFVFVDPLEKENTQDREHYELVYHGDVLTEILYRDENGNAKVDDNYKAAIVRRRYDKESNMVEESSYDPDGKLKNDWYGFAVYRWEYDENHRRVSGAFYGPDARLTHKRFSEVAVTRWAFDRDGNQVLCMNYDMAGRLTKDILGAAARTCRYDDRGQKTLEVSYGPDRKLTNGKYGYAVIFRDYDENGNIVEVSYYGSDLEPSEVRGAAVQRTKRHPEKNSTETASYNREGMLTANNEGIAIVLDFYDEDGKRIRQRLYDQKKRLVCELILDADTGKWRRTSPQEPAETEED